MSNFIIRNKVQAFLKSDAKAPLIEIEFLGSGGAFDIKEKNSSVLLKTARGNILIDCGFTVYQELVKRKLLNKLDYIFITHLHEDHIGSLSTLIHHKYFIDKEKVKIECVPELAQKLKYYLVDITGVLPEAFEINSNKEGDIYKDLNMRIIKINTTNYHFKEFVSSGFIFQMRKSEQNIFIVYSGDINIPIINIIQDEHINIYKKMLEQPDNVFIFHEATARSYPPYFPHTEFQKLLEVSKTFFNIYTYHHSNEETKIMSNYQNKQRKLNIALNKINLELEKKSKQTSNEKQVENLKEQALKLKNMFKEEFKNVTKDGFVHDINSIGQILVIQEEKGNLK